MDDHSLSDPDQASAADAASAQAELPPPALRAGSLRDDILHHLTYSLGKDVPHASLYDWRMALSFALRDRVVLPWFQATRHTYRLKAKRVFYLSMEYLIGRLLEDAAQNLGLTEEAQAAIADLGVDWEALVEDEPDAALGNGGLGRLAACFMDSLATLGVPAYGYGLRYEHGLFRQRFEGGQQVETPEDWLSQKHPWEFERPESAYEVGFGGTVEWKDGRAHWLPGASVLASAHDTPVVGWQARWANTLRLWSAGATTLFDLARFNSGDYAAAEEPEALARTITRVLYPDDTTYAGKELRLKQEYFLCSASVQDILRRAYSQGLDPRRLHEHVAIQLNDTHPALAAPELVRLLVDVHLVDFDEAAEIALQTLGYTNHTLLPEALERWSTFLVGTTLPRHMQIIEGLDDWHKRKFPARKPSSAIVRDDQVHMGEMSFIMAHRVNGVSALHSKLVASELFPDLAALHPGRIVNETNGITPRRWLHLANPGLAALATEAVGEGWEVDLDRLSGLEPLATDPAFQGKFRAVRRGMKLALSEWLGEQLDPAALFDVQIKRMHEYKRQLLNLLETVALWQGMKAGESYPARVKIFGGKAAPGYGAAKEIIRLINDVGAVLNVDPATRERLRIVFPPNYNVSMAQRLIPAADLSEQISTAGMEASGTGNMKLALNGALTIGTLDGANVEIRERVGEENFFLFGLTASEVEARRAQPGHGRAAIERSPRLRAALDLIAGGAFSPGEPGRYRELVGRIWDSDWFLVASDFDSYWAQQRMVEAVWARPGEWDRMAILNVARMGFFSSDRTISGYMKDIWGVQSAL